jgi:hypothetical protein
MESMKKSHIVSFLSGALLMLCLTLGIQSSRAQAPGHVFELRIYHATPGKLDALKARFRDHTITIFNRFNMKSVGYFTPQDNPDNLLIYMLEHPNRAEGDKNWAAFNADPEWKKVLAESQANGSLTTKIERTWLDPTDFSALK